MTTKKLTTEQKEAVDEMVSRLMESTGLPEPEARMMLAANLRKFYGID